MRAGLIAAAALLCASPLAAQQPADASQAGEQTAELQQALDRGQNLYAYDQAAWHATDAFLADLPDAAALGVRGWVTEDGADGLRVTFYRPLGGSFVGVWSGLWNADGNADGGVSERKRLDDTPLSADALEQIAIRAMIAGETLVRCADSPFNVIILPREEGAAVRPAYAMTPLTTMREVPLGGHTRWMASAAGLGERLDFANSCIAMPGPEAGEGASPVAFGVTYPNGSTPSEVHIWAMMTAGLPLYVIADKRTWAVEASGGQARARLVRRE